MKYKALFQLNTAAPTSGKTALRQINNALEALQSEVLIQLVVHGEGLAWVLRDDTPFASQLLELSRKGVKIVVCQNSLASRQITDEELLPFVQVVPSAVAYLIQYQQEGWSYVKI